MDINDIINYILKNDLLYPGLHQHSAPRTGITQKLLEPKTQLLLIWSSFCKDLKEKLNEGTSVSIENFGTFTFKTYNAINTKNSILFTSSIIDPLKLIKNRMDFRLDSVYKNIITNYKNETNNKKILQTGNTFEKKSTIKWNPYKPAKYACLKDKVVMDGMKAIIKAIYDLVEKGENLLIDTHICEIAFKDNKMICSFEIDQYAYD